MVFLIKYTYVIYTIIPYKFKHYFMLLTFLCFLLFSNGLTFRSDTSILYTRIGLIILSYCIISALDNFYLTYIEKGIMLYGGLFHITSITQSFQIFILIISILILSITAFYPRKINSEMYSNNSFSYAKQAKDHISSLINKTGEQFTIIEYALIVIFAVSGATLLITSGDMTSLYLCLELQSFSLYIISSIYRNSESATGSALTYFLLGGLSSCFILLGIALIYANSGLTNLDGIYSIISDSEKYTYYSTWYNHSYFFYSLLLISVGLLFKIAAAPFHWWSPDVYDGVPTIVTTFIAILGKIAILIIFLELVHYTGSLFYSTTQSYSWTTSLSLSCFFSLLIGTILGLSQSRIKRLLAYSTISHIGFILLALVVHTLDSFQAFMFYVFQYILTNFNVFMIVIAMGFNLYLYYTNTTEFNNLSEKNYSPIQLINQIKGYFTINPLLALFLVITMFSFIGLPPLVGFFAKLMVLTSALDNGKILLVLVAVFTSVIGAVYYLNIIKTIYFEKTEYKSSYDGFFFDVSLSNVFSVTLSVLNLAVLMFILIPDELLNICDLLSITCHSSNSI